MFAFVSFSQCSGFHGLRPTEEQGRAVDGSPEKCRHVSENTRCQTFQWLLGGWTDEGWTDWLMGKRASYSAGLS